MARASGAVISAYWQPTYWKDCPEPIERDLRAVVAGWKPRTHGDRDPGFALQGRDVDLLCRLWAHGPLLTDHLRRMFWPDTDRADTAVARLRRLWDVGLLRRYWPRLHKGVGSAPVVWTLSRAAFGLLELIRPLWWVTRYPGARWDARREAAGPGTDLAHGLIVADVATWAVRYQGREWVHESEPAGTVVAGIEQVGARTRERVFRPDAILTRDGEPHWYVEVERSVYLPRWRHKLDAWSLWVDAQLDDEAVIVVVGRLRATADQREKSMIPLLRATPVPTAARMRVLDLGSWDPADPDVPWRPVGEVLAEAR